MPVPRGGGAKLADALVQLIRDHGGVCETDRDVERVLVRSGRAVGVKLTDGETIEAERAVVANVTPTQLHERLLADADVPAPVAEGARRFRYGRSEMQIHYALSEPPRWDGDERLARTAIVHVTPGLDGVSRAVNEAERGLLPDGGDDRRRPAAHARPLACARGSRAALDPAPGAAVADQGPRRRCALRRQRRVDGRAPRALRRPDPGTPCATHPQPRVVDPQAGRARPARPAAGERQPPARRPVRRLARARPELPLAALRAQSRTHDAGRAALADRREHLAGAGSRRRIGDARRAEAPRAAAHAARGRSRPLGRGPLGCVHVLIRTRLA